MRNAQGVRLMRASARRLCLSQNDHHLKSSFQFLVDIAKIAKDTGRIQDIELIYLVMIKYSPLLYEGDVPVSLCGMALFFLQDESQRLVIQSRAKTLQGFLHDVAAKGGLKEP